MMKTYWVYEIFGLGSNEPELSKPQSLRVEPCDSLPEAIAKSFTDAIGYIASGFQVGVVFEERCNECGGTGMTPLRVGRYESAMSWTTIPCLACYGTPVVRKLPLAILRAPWNALISER